MKRVALMVGVLLAGCAPGADTDGVPLERGLWKISTTFGTPRLDGLSIDRLRDQLPRDKSETKCDQPVLRSGSRFMEIVNMKRDVCTFSKASIAEGRIAAEGACPGIAAAVASESSDSWIKVNGSYTPQYVDVALDVVITATGGGGATARMTIAATHKAEKIGECP